MLENDCEDQGFSALSGGCQRCRIGFNEEGKAIYAEIILSDGFWTCSNCGGSYGPVDSNAS